MGRGTERRTISRDPLINQLHRRLEVILAGAAGLFVVYTTCLPAVGITAAPTAPTSPSIQDCVQNILLYLPLGFFTALALRERTMPWAVTFGSTTALAVLVATVAEQAQQFMPGRVSSFVDVLCNVCGMFAGTTAAWLFREILRDGARRLRSHLAREPLFTTFLAALCLYVILSLVPFQLDLNPGSHRQWFDAERLTAYTPARASELILADGDLRTRNDRILDILSSGLAAAGLGILAFGGLCRELRFRWPMALIVSVWIVFMAGGGIIGIQMFIRHVEVQVFVLPTMVAGTIAGALIWALAAPREGLLTWRWGLLGATLWCVALITLRELNPFNFEISLATLRDQWSESGLIPFRKYFADARTFDASSDMLAKLGRFAVLGWTSTMWVMAGRTDDAAPRGTCSARRKAIGVGVALAASIEALQLFCPGRSVDVTHILLACGGTASGTVAAHYWLDLLSSTQQGASATRATSTTPTPAGPQPAVT